MTFPSGLPDDSDLVRAGSLAHLQTVLDVAFGYHDTAVLLFPRRRQIRSTRLWPRVTQPLLENTKDNLFYYSDSETPVL